MKMYQQFHLDKEWADKERSKTGRSPESLTVASADRLLSGVAQMGYEVLQGSEALNGVPTTVIIGGESRRNPKDDFYRLAEELGLRFRSGDYFRSAK